jgi:hypothetical protein
VSTQTWAIVGVVVGALLGGVAQIVADILRSGREHARELRDVRRSAAVAMLEAEGMA